MKKLFKILKHASFLLFGFLTLYIAAVFLIPKITINAEESPKSNLNIYIRTNGVHTDIVVPAVNEYKDWTNLFPYSNTKNNDSSLQYLAIGWGDKGFYLETPSWDELKVSTALKACIGYSGSAIHATYYKDIEVNDRCKKLNLTKDQYLRLINYIEEDIKLDTARHPIHIKTTGLYGINDAFYEAKGRYNIFYSCNTWANDALKSCGQKACLWTVLQSGIFKKYESN